MTKIHNAMYGIVLFAAYMSQLYGIYIKIALKSMDTVHMGHMPKLQLIGCN